MTDSGLLKLTPGARLAVWLVLAPATLLWFVPVASALYNSFKFFGLGNYTYVLTSSINDIHFGRALLNSMVIAAASVSMTTLTSALAGFCFSKLQFPLRNAAYILTLSLLSIPGVTILVPLFFTLRSLGLLNTHLSVSLPQVALTLPFGVLLMRNTFDGIDNDYMGAASIDGANRFQTFFWVYLPMSKPALINLAILQFVWSFQDFLLPTYFLSRPSLMTATQMVSSFNRTQTISPKDIGGFNAALILLAVPVVAVFLIFSRQIKRGLISGGIKG